MFLDWKDKKDFLKIKGCSKMLDNINKLPI